jgi:hypothetical protein
MSADSIKKLTEEDGVVFLIYASFLTQMLISSIADVLEKEAEARGMESTGLNGVYTVLIELAQNMMNYAKAQEDTVSVGAKRTDGLIWVGRNRETGNYYVQSRNLVSAQDKAVIDHKLSEVLALDADALKLRYRELRRSGLYAHEKGGGIGFYEIAKRSSNISYQFVSADAERFYFDFRADIAVKK